jgi:beta-lactamase class A
MRGSSRSSPGHQPSTVVRRTYAVAPRDYRRQRRRRVRLRDFFLLLALAVSIGLASGWLLNQWGSAPLETASPAAPAEPTHHSLPAPDSRAASLRPVPPATPQPASLEQILTAHLPADNGTIAVYVLHTRTGHEVALNADRRMTAASLFKVPVMVEVFRQQRQSRFTWEQTLVVGPQHWVPGTGILQASLGRRVSVRELVQLMMSVSDNVASVMLMDLVGRENINETAKALGLRDTLVHTYTARDPLGPDEDNTTSARDLGLLLRRMVAGELIDRAASAAMIELMMQERVYDWMLRELPEGVRVAHKTGALPNVRNDAGIIFTPGGEVVLVVLMNDLRDQEQGEETIGTIARLVFEYYQGR